MLSVRSTAALFIHTDREQTDKRERCDADRQHRTPYKSSAEQNNTATERIQPVPEEDKKQRLIGYKV